MSNSTMSMDWSTVGALATVAAGAAGAYLLYKSRSKPQIGDCCPGQSAGFLPQDPNYSPKGTIIVIGDGVEAYTVGTGNNFVIILHDVFGLHSGRHKQIADEFATRGFNVVVPDFFGSAGGGLFGKDEGRGYGMSVSRIAKFLFALVSGKVKGFQRQHPWTPVCEKMWVGSIAPYLKSHGCATAGLVSFCWGAYPAMHIAADTSGVNVTANVCFHPSFDRTAVHFGEDQEALVRAAAKVPTYVVATSMESAAWKPEGQAQKLMREAIAAIPDGGKNKPPQPRWQLVGQIHGFMTRGDMKGNLKLAQDVQRVLEEAIQFMKEQCGCVTR